MLETTVIATVAVVASSEILLIAATGRREQDQRGAVVEQALALDEGREAPRTPRLRKVAITATGSVAATIAPTTSPARTQAGGEIQHGRDDHGESTTPGAASRTIQPIVRRRCSASNCRAASNTRPGTSTSSTSSGGFLDRPAQERTGHEAEDHEADRVRDAKPARHDRRHGGDGEERDHDPDRVERGRVAGSRHRSSLEPTGPIPPRRCCATTALAEGTAPNRTEVRLGTQEARP